VAFSPIKNGGEVYILLEGLVDLKAESAKLEKDRQKLEKYVLSIEAKLHNEQFVKNAPLELVEGEKAKQKETKDKISRIEKNLKFLYG
jgi:valyl-tRNA synthetase